MNHEILEALESDRERNQDTSNWFAHEATPEQQQGMVEGMVWEMSLRYPDISERTIELTVRDYYEGWKI
jgi:hypothetical protein